MNIIYKNKKINNGNYLTPNESKIKPIIKYKSKLDTLYTIIVYDPDAPTGNHIHWLIVNIKNNKINNYSDILLEYKGPVPPKGSGIHRYIFLLFEQDNIINVNNIKKINRIIEMDDLYNILNVKLNLIQKTYFISKYENNYIL
jgi:phosphatidylethanolamine-binding protein (PEBP) family uncharacterized protein